MIVDRKWAARNLGFDPKTTPPPASTFSFRPAARAAASTEDLQREIIDFDSEAPEGKEFLSFTTATGLSRFTNIPWPKSLAPMPDTTARKGPDGSLPAADVLVVTWTTDEGHALSRVLTPGKDSRNDYLPYTHNFDTISKKMRGGCPALELHRLGTYWTTNIGKKKVIVFKSDSHMSQDGPQLPNIDVWRQIITESRAPFVITTGTAGGIGKQFEVGDVIVSPLVRFDCISKFKNKVVDGQPIAHAQYSSVSPKTKNLSKANTLFKANSGRLPPDNTRPPKIVRVSPTALKSCVVTTDFFGFDTSDNHYKLWGLGDVSEMGDAVLGLVAKEMGSASPRWVAVRNVSDPEIKAEGTLQDQAKMAAQIYKAFGRWSSVCSAIVCWALITAD
jgi:Phosphorylase superfamily